MASLVSSLIRPVVKALAATGLSQKDLLSGAIEFTDLPWQAPALNCTAKLGGVPVSQYLDTHHPRLRVDGLVDFWDNALVQLRFAPMRVAEEDGWRAASYALPDSKPGERALWLSMPEGFPSTVSEYEGITLSMECAHLLRIGGQYADFVTDEDNYHAVLADGRIVGVKDGLPARHADQWDLPVTGMVQELLMLPRGRTSTTCDYDLIAKLRSVVWSRQAQLAEFEGIDWALQTLRVLSHGAQLPEVLRSVSVFDANKRISARRVQVVKEALDLMGVVSISDRSRMIAIRSLLVPEVLSISKYRSRIYSSDDIPAALSPKIIAKINERLQLLLEEEQSNEG